MYQFTNKNSDITLALFTILLTLLIFGLIFVIGREIIKISKLSNSNEEFYNKRDQRMKIYKSDEIFDPDEQPEFDEYDPDSNPSLFDPDQQPNLDDETITIEKIRKIY